MEIIPRFDQVTISLNEDGLRIEQETNSSEPCILFVPKIFISSFLEVLDQVLRGER